MAEVTWLGDADPSVQSIEQYGYTFVRGEPVKVPDDDKNMGKFKHMSVFHVGKGKPEVVEPVKEEPKEQVDPEVAALRADLDAVGHKWHHKSSAETLRRQLAEAQAALPRQKAEHTAQ